MSQSGELRLTGDRNRPHLERAPFVTWWGQVELGVHALFPRQLLAGVSRHAARNRHHRTVRHVLAVIDRLAVADAAEERVVLELIHVAFVSLVTPDQFTGCSRRCDA